MLNFPQLGTMHTFTAKLKTKLPTISLDSFITVDCPISYSCHLELLENSLKRVTEVNKCLYKVKSQKAQKQITLSGKDKMLTPPKRKMNNTERPSKKMKVTQLSLSTYLVKI